MISDKGFLVFLAGAATLLLVGCFAPVAYDPGSVSFRFSDDASGECTFTNKRGTWHSRMPAFSMLIRPSDDPLVYDCQTADGRSATGSIPSEQMERKTVVGDILWIDQTITTYRGKFVIPVPSRESE